MAHINFARREVTCKVVYYGPGMSGKTTNLEMVHQKAPQSSKGELTSIATEGDRTLFFDFLPLDLGEVAGMRTKFQLYTVPGQVYYDSTRKLVLQGADGVAFIADSQSKKKEENKESLENLFKNLRENGVDPDEVPLVLQWNKRDMDGIMPIEEMEAHLNPDGKWPTFEGVAFKGEGVMQTLKELSKLVLQKLNEEYGQKGGSRSAVKPATAPPPAAPAETPAPEAPAAPEPKPEAAAAPAPPPPPAPTPEPPKPAPEPPAPKPEAKPETKPKPKEPAGPSFKPTNAPAKKKGCAGVLLAAVAIGISALAILVKLV